MVAPVALLLLLLGVFTLAAPLSELQSNVTISERQLDPTGTFGPVACTSNGLPLRVSEGAQRDAFQGLKTNFNLPRAQKPTSNSGRVYPHRYDADDASRSPEVQAKLNKFGECMTGFGTDGRTFLEFPVKYAVVGTGNVYTGGDPGAVHVIAVRIPAANGRPALYHYCLTVTHERWGSPHFVPCR